MRTGNENYSSGISIVVAFRIIIVAVVVVVVVYRTITRFRASFDGTKRPFNPPSVIAHARTEGSWNRWETTKGR